MKTTTKIDSLIEQKARLQAVVASLSRKVKAGSIGDYAQTLADRSAELQSVDEALNQEEALLAACRT